MPQNKQMKENADRLRLIVREKMNQVQVLEEERAMLQEKFPHLQSDVALVQALQRCAHLQNSELQQAGFLFGKQSTARTFWCQAVLCRLRVGCNHRQEMQHAAESTSSVMQTQASCSSDTKYGSAPHVLSWADNSSIGIIGLTCARNSSSTMVHTLMCKEQEVQQLMKASTAHVAGLGFLPLRQQVLLLLM